VLRIVTVERGLDPREFTMVAFGGNGPLHGCALAEELGIRRVIVPEYPGVFSAHGLLVAGLRASFVRPVLRESSDVSDAFARELFESLEREGRALLLEQGAAENTIAFRREYDMRYRGQSFELAVEHVPKMSVVVERFHAQHERRYGYAVSEEAVEFVNARLTATAPAGEQVSTKSRHDAKIHDDTNVEEREVWISGAYVETPVYKRESLPAHAMVGGPALIEQYDTCTYVPPGWSAKNVEAMLVVERL
jgi:N-methylhydantoinase A